MSNLVIVEKSDGVLTMTLNDPEKRNPVSGADMVDAIIDALEAAEADPDIRCIVLTGNGSAFSSGGDLKTMLSPGGLADENPVKTRLNYKRGIQRIPLAFDALELPVVAAVNGPAIGAGLDLALMCDIRVAARSARFAESFVKVGIVPGDGGAFLLPRVVGEAKAAEMALTGDMLDAQEALGCGLVSKVVEDDDLLPTARTIAEKIASNPPHAVRMTKRLLKLSRSAGLAEILDVSASMQALAHTTQDHREAVDAFLSKRKPEYKGR